MVDEAVEIFKMCGTIIEDLDQTFAEQAEKVAWRSSMPSSAAMFMTEQLYGILTWICRLVWAAVSTAERRGNSPGHGMVRRESVGVER